MPPVYRELYDIIIVNKSYAEQPDRRKGQIISPGGLFMDYNDQKLKNFDLKYNFLLPTLSLVLYYMLMLMVVEAIPGLNLSLLRSEEHTSELQSRPHLVCRLLLEKKKT